MGGTINLNYGGVNVYRFNYEFANLLWKSRFQPKSLISGKNALHQLHTLIYLHFRGLYEVERKPRIKKIDTDLINRIKENEDMIMRRDELNKREGFERGFKSGYDEGMKEGLKKGLDDGYKNGVSKAMLTFIKNNLRIEDLLKVEEYTELVRN